jgi:hypothetical protein
MVMRRSTPATGKEEKKVSGNLIIYKKEVLMQRFGIKNQNLR